MKATILPISLLSLSLFGMQEFDAQSSMGPVKVYHDGREFSVVHKDRLYKVKPAWLDSDLRNATSAQLLALKKNGYVTVNQLDNGDMVLRSHLKLKGGGPILGGIFYVGTKGVCWGVVSLATAFGMKQILDGTRIQNTAADAASSGAGHMGNAIIRNGLGCAGEANFMAGATQAALEKALIANAANPEVAAMNAAAAAIGMNTSNMAMAGGLSAWIEGISLAAYEAGLAIPWW